MKNKFNKYLKWFKFEYLPISPKWFVISFIIIVILILYVLISARFQTEDFILNLITEIIGVWVSTFIIGFMLNLYAKKNWQPLESKLTERLEYLIKLPLYEFFRLTGILNLFDFPDLLINSNALHLAYINELKKDLTNKINEFIENLDELDINGLILYSDLALEFIIDIDNRFLFMYKNIPHYADILDDLKTNLTTVNLNAKTYKKYYLSSDKDLTNKDDFHLAHIRLFMNKSLMIIFKKIVEIDEQLKFRNS